MNVLWLSNPHFVPAQTFSLYILHHQTFSFACVMITAAARDACYNNLLAQTTYEHQFPHVCMIDDGWHRQKILDFQARGYHSIRTKTRHKNSVFSTLFYLTVKRHSSLTDTGSNLMDSTVTILTCLYICYSLCCYRCLLSLNTLFQISSGIFVNCKKTLVRCSYEKTLKKYLRQISL